MIQYVFHVELPAEHLRHVTEAAASLGLDPAATIWTLGERICGGKQFSNKANRYTRHGSLPRDADTIECRERISLALRRRGLSYPEIAAAVGYRSHAAAFDACRRQLAREERRRESHDSRG